MLAGVRSTVQCSARLCQKLSISQIQSAFRPATSSCTVNSTVSFSLSQSLGTRSAFSTESLALPELDSRRLVIERTQDLKPKPKEDDSLKWGACFTDHMLVAEFDSGTGWSAPVIRPFQNLQISPASSALQYGVECFEGMKAYKDPSRRALLFRPEMNMNRLNDSALRISLPGFDREELLRLICELLVVDYDWIPNTYGFSLYIRPTIIASNTSLGVQAPNRATLFAIASPVGPYFPHGFKPLRLFADDVHVRAWPGGTGGFKVGSNYAGTMLPHKAAIEGGCHMVLWLFGQNHAIQEAGTMNMFVFMINEQGERELVTPPLDGCILPGITRDSILTLARSWGEFTVSERRITMPELIRTLNEGRVLEAFGAGTAAIVCPVEAIVFKGQEYTVPMTNAKPDAKVGELTERFFYTLMDIQTGRQPSEWSVPVDSVVRLGYDRSALAALAAATYESEANGGVLRSV